MTAFETIRVALESIIHNLLRSTLTMLGIIIGVAAVIAIVALITGAQRAVDEQISSLGAGVVSVAPGQSFFRGVASADRVSMTIDDYEALRRDAHHLAEIVPEISSYRQIQYGNQNLRHRINGTTPNYPGVHGIDLAHGRMFSEGDLAARRRVAVLGQEIPVNLDIEPENIIGRMISIDRVAFQVIGVFEEVGLPWQNPDDDVFIPLSTAELRVFGSDRLDRMSAKVAEGIPLETGMVDIERVMRREHKIRPGAANDFMIMNPQQFVEAQQQSMAIFAFLLGGVASVSLVVGGIGVMNIMLVSVTERIREIGVRKALGATRFDILTQFLTEASTIGTLGGLIGIALGWGVAWAMAQLAGFNTVVSVEAVLLAFGVSCGIGLVFGVWPARRAAQLDPIEALRHD